MHSLELFAHHTLLCLLLWESGMMTVLPVFLKHVAHTNQYCVTNSIKRMESDVCFGAALKQLSFAGLCFWIADSKLH